MWVIRQTSTRGTSMLLVMIDMAEVALRRHLVAHDLLELLDLWKPAMLRARPDQLAFDPDLEHAAGIVGDQGNRAELLGEGREQLLAHPGCPQQPVAKPAISDCDIWARRHGKKSHFTRQRAMSFVMTLPYRSCLVRGRNLPISVFP